ncbi:hypothetical protein BTM25_38040 [Actinomadura rubteroloni]|uniref:Uncharacterized protein n=2 Tax=Actinomadura rubteroloni TaxID=1926885 RepID=A0A2P4UJF4_9ACTN|nr:hypothetical protein BTM25_38040 [Actinomadura rubteroloni]
MLSAPPGPADPGMPANQRVVFLEALSLTLREHYPGVLCEIRRFRAGLPPVMRVTWGNEASEIGCDLSGDGWNFVHGLDPRRVIGPAGSLSASARAVACALGLGRHPDH